MKPYQIPQFTLQEIGLQECMCTSSFEGAVSNESFDEEMNVLIW